MDIHRLRREYSKDGLNRNSLLPDPVNQFNVWFEQALEVEIKEPNAMTLATVSASGQPSARTVLLKYYDQSGFVFFTNYESRKAKEILENPKAALLLYWYELARQVRIEGLAEKVTNTESLKYFLSRPKGSQLGAWCSNQSSIISSRQLLMTKFEELKTKFKNKEMSLPSFWGGYRINPLKFEFWQGRDNRLHDRFLYTQGGDENWRIDRLAP